MMQEEREEQEEEGVSMNLSNNIVCFRKERGLTQEQLAEETELSLAVIQKLEAGRSGSRIETLIRIAVTLEVSLDSLTDISEADEKYRFQQEAAYLLFRDKTVNELKYVIAVVDSIFKYKQEFLD